MTEAAQKRSLLSRLAAIDDGNIIRAAFTLLLAGTIAVLYIDYQELSAESAMAVITPDMPVLPAFNPSSPDLPAGPSVTTDPELLRQPLTIALTNGGILELTGTIEPGAAERFRTEVEARGEYIKTVRLDSPGGVVTEALQIGALLREKGFGTLVENGALCASSCPLIFASGVTRTAAPGAAIGVHQIYAAIGTADQLKGGARAAGEAMSNTQSVTATITRHLTDMGIDAALWINALETPPDRLYYFSREELERYRLVTVVPDATTAAHRSGTGVGGN